MSTPTSLGQVVPIRTTGYVTIDALLGPYEWSGPITYSFPGAGAYWSTNTLTGYGSSVSGQEPWNANFSPLSIYDQPFFISALSKWTSLTALSVTQVADSSTSAGDIRAAYTYQAADSNAQAWAYFPATSSKSGDVWFNALGTSATELWTPGSYTNFTIVHELGHALGLKHPFDGVVTLPTAWESQEYTVMSYTALPGKPGSQMTYYPTTPMVLDVAAIQYLYGANYKYNAGDTTYSYADSKLYNETIWDGGGNDTIRYDGSWNGTIDLNEGHGSAIGRPVYAGTSAQDMTSINNVWIAYGAQIENAIGGQGNDVITGNALGNLLAGRDGNDVINAGAGNDVLIGGNGNDQLNGDSGTDLAVYTGQRSSYTVTVSGGRPTTVDGPEGHDTLTSVERLAFANVNVAYDLDGPTGAVAKIIGAVFGASQLTNKAYVGIGLDYMDRGSSYVDVMATALGARLGSAYTVSAEVDLLYRNVTGSAASTADNQYWTAKIGPGQYTTATLAIMAADTSMNASNIGLVGLTKTGLEFVYP